MTPNAAPEDDRLYTIVVHAADLTDAEAEALFDRVADAAHALNQAVGCVGGYDIEARLKAAALREAAEEWSEWEVVVDVDGERFIRRHGKPPDVWLRDRADWAEKQVES